MNRFAHKHGRLEKTDAATKQGRHGRAGFYGRGEVLRCSKRLVICNGNHALRGAVNWGAEKNRVVDIGRAGIEFEHPGRENELKICGPEE
jgi:hypothetical protein